MTKLASVSHTRWAFYEAMESKDIDTMASWFDTLFIHYQNRGKKIKSLLTQAIKESHYKPKYTYEPKFIPKKRK